jgi:hypothetical protein
MTPLAHDPSKENLLYFELTSQRALEPLQEEQKQ